MTRTRYVLLFLVSILFASPAFATLTGFSVVPPEPTVCDSVTLEAQGVLPTSCYDVVSAVLRGPVPVVCPTEPCPFEYFLEITVREPNPAETCLAQNVPYTRSFPLGLLPPGVKVAFARERVIPWFADSTDSIVAYSERLANFYVRGSCVPGVGCYLLNLHDPTARLSGPCDGLTGPGGTACLPVNLSNSVDVGGVQTSLSVEPITTPFPAGSFHVTSVEPVQRAAGFQVSWSEQNGKTKILLYSPDGAVIPRGDGPVLRVCYSVSSETPPSRYWVVDQDNVVADPEGNALLPCPTPAIFAPGVLCVVTPGCDLNQDGISDVLDIIRLVRCALGAPNDTIPCPSATDCNGDGATDIRDVICCVRKIVQQRPGPDAASYYPTGFAPGEEGRNQIGFVGPVRWTSAISGSATLRVDAAADWGGTQFAVDTRGTPVRIRSLDLVDTPSGVKLEWAVGEDGIARAILYSGVSGPGSAWSGRIEIRMDRVSATSGVVELRDLKAGTADGVNTGIFAASPTLQIEAGAPPAAPQLFAARPNPFTAMTEIAFVLPADRRATLHIYDVRGRLVRALVDGPTFAGPHFARWDGTDERGHASRSGIYFAKLTVGSVTKSERIMLLR